MASQISSSAQVSTDEAIDRDLIVRVSKGDRQAFTEIYKRYARRVGAYLWKMLRDTDLVDEALNDTMIVVWQKASDFHFQSRLSTWMIGIAHNKALKLLAKQTRIRSRESAAIEADEFVDNDSPMKRTSRTELLKSLANALDRLSHEHRSVMELTFFEGMSYTEVAEVVDCPVNTVKTRVFHARKQLHKFLREEGVDTDTDEHLNLS